MVKAMLSFDFTDQTFRYCDCDIGFDFYIFILIFDIIILYNTIL